MKEISVTFTKGKSKFLQNYRGVEGDFTSLLSKLIFTHTALAIKQNGFELVTRGFELVTRGFELALLNFSSCFRISTRNWQLVTRVLPYHAFSLASAD